ncbi:MAG TPA: hypothetical protein VF426_13940 [Marmoricola sp.]
MSKKERDHEQDWWVRVAAWGAVAVLVGFIVFCGVWRLEGGKWERVETPSMGTVAPVGTLLWIKPVDFDKLKPGDFITFHPPGKAHTTYSHRVYERNADGTISTKGVIPAPDPWKLSASNVVGEVHMRWWGVGWIVAAAPILIIGFLIVLAIRAVLSRDWKLPATILLGSLVVTAAIVYYKPFINAEQLSFAQSKTGGADASYVGTGLLPIRLKAHDGPSVVMRDGEVGTVHVTKEDAQHRLRVDLKPAVPWWLWLVLILVCFLPALYSLFVGFPPLDDEPARHRDEPEPA